MPFLNFWSGSCAVRDHKRSNLGIICGSGSFAVLGSFADPYRPLVECFSVNKPPFAIGVSVIKQKQLSVK